MFAQERSVKADPFIKGLKEAAENIQVTKMKMLRWHV